jgi:hypothetical protein
MYRSRLIVGMLVLCAACSDDVTAPMPQGQWGNPAPESLNLVGIVELTGKEPIRYVLHQADGQLVPLVWANEALCAMLGREVVATGKFRDGAFIVAKMQLGASKPAELVTVRTREAGFQRKSGAAALAVRCPF